MAAPRPSDYVETFAHALDSICVTLELMLDKDVMSDEPMADLVRSEIEDEFEIFSNLQAELKSEAQSGPESFGIYVTGWRDVLELALDFHENRLTRSMKSVNELDYNPPFKKTKAELESIKLAKQSLNSSAQA